MPEISLVTVPVPLPDRVMDRILAFGPGAKIAVILISALMVTTQLPVPVHPPPLQPWKTKPDDALAVSVTALPAGKSKLQPDVAPVQERPGRLAAPSELLVT